MPDPVIVVDAQGVEHEFPAGFDPVVAARIVKQQATPPRRASAKTGGFANADPNLAPDWGKASEGFIANFNPMAYLRAGKALVTTNPVTTAKNLTVGARDQIGDILSGGTEDGRASAAIGGLVGAAAVAPAIRTTGRVAAAVGPATQNAAVSWYERLLKPNRSTIEGMTRFGRTQADRSRNIATELIKDPNARITRGGADAFDQATRRIQERVGEIVDANPEARGSTQHLADALAEGRRISSNQWANSADTAAYDRVAKDALSNPRINKLKRAEVDTWAEQQMGLAPNASEIRVVGTERLPRVRAATARDLTQGTYRNLSDKAYGEIQGPAVEAHKAAARGGRAMLNEALPAVEPLNNTIASRIDLGQVLDEAALRGGKHDVVGLGEKVSAAGQRPAMFGASVLSRPGLGSISARGLYRLGGSLSRASNALPTIDANVLRAAIFDRLLQQAEQPQSNER